jgi:glutathione S-transferase
MTSLLQAPFNTEVSPNGRVPAINDPNTGLTLWESGAINQYLVDTYDKDQTISYTTSPEKHLCNQWLHFQASGQGPYYGQAAWFQHYHSEQIPSAVDRYLKEMERVMGVLETHLKKEGTPYLVGVKCTYADLSFVTWHNMVPFITGKDRKIDIEGKYPTYHAWMKRMWERPAVKKTLEDKAKAMGQ